MLHDFKRLEDQRIQREANTEREGRLRAITAEITSKLVLPNTAKYKNWNGETHWNLTGADPKHKSISKKTQKYVKNGIFHSPLKRSGGAELVARCTAVRNDDAKVSVDSAPENLRHTAVHTAYARNFDLKMMRQVRDKQELRGLGLGHGFHIIHEGG